MEVEKLRDKESARKMNLNNSIMTPYVNNSFYAQE